MQPYDTEWTIGGAFSAGWDRFKSNVGLLVVVFLVIFAVSVVLSLIVNTFAEPGTGVGMLLSLGINAVNIVLAMGLIRIALKLIDEVPTSAADLFAVDMMFWSFLGASILFGLMMFVGLILFIIPGIIVAVVFGYFSYVIVDQAVWPLDALKVSAAITKGTRWRLFGFGIVLFFFNILGVITLIGWLITWPVSALAGASVYRSLAGPRDGSDTIEPYPSA